MNTIKMSKVLALVVVVAMVMAVMPVAFAAGEEVTSTKFYGWNFTKGIIRNDINVDTAQAAVVSWGSDDRVSFVEFELPEGTTISGNQMLKANISFMAYGNEGKDNSTVATIFAVDPDAVESEDNTKLVAAREAGRNVKVGTVAFNFTERAKWNTEPSVGEIAVPAANVKGGKVAFMLSNRKEDGVERNGIASLKDAKLLNIQVVDPDAAVNVRIMADTTVLQQDNENYEMKYFVGDKFSLP